MFAGNLLVPSAVFLTGNSFTSFHEMAQCADLATLTSRQCSNLQRAYMIPEVTHMWDRHCEGVLAATGDRPIIVAGDARCDSPGHNATFGTYTMMDTESQLILAQETVRVTDDDVSNSYWLEPEGLKRCLKTLEVGLSRTLYLHSQITFNCLQLLQTYFNINSTNVYITHKLILFSNYYYLLCATC